MLFQYQALDDAGKPTQGSVTAVSESTALAILQRRGMTVTSISGEGEGAAGIFKMSFSFFGGASNKDVVLLSREIATLFEAQVSALRVFQLLAEQTEKLYLKGVLTQISDDLQEGDSLSKALGKHPKVFSEFYVNMVRAGEESGKLDQTFLFLADYLDRAFELTSKVRNSLMYPAFVLTTFVVVMLLMLTIVIPKISSILTESGADIPIYTKFVIGLSQFMVDYGIFILVFAIIGGFFFARWGRTPAGRVSIDRTKITIPFMGNLYRKLYLARIADNMHVMLSSGITAVRALEITATVVDNRVYQGILSEAVEMVKAGSTMSAALGQHPKELPPILTQMMKIGEETGELSTILDRLARFYQREVNTAVDTLVTLIEPALIVLLGVGVGFLLASILVPIYNIAGTI